MSIHTASLVKIPCYLLKLSSGNENMGMSLADNSVKITRNLPFSNPKPDIYNINAHTKFGENPLMFTQVIIRKRKMDGWTVFWLCWGLTTRQPLRVILCRLPEKGRKEIEERVEEMKARDREERGTGMKVKKQKK